MKIPQILGKTNSAYHGSLNLELYPLKFSYA